MAPVPFLQNSEGSTAPATCLNTIEASPYIMMPSQPCPASTEAFNSLLE